MAMMGLVNSEIRVKEEFLRVCLLIVLGICSRVSHLRRGIVVMEYMHMGLMRMVAGTLWVVMGGMDTQFLLMLLVTSGMGQ